MLGARIDARATPVTLYPVLNTRDNALRKWLTQIMRYDLFDCMYSRLGRVALEWHRVASTG